LFPHVDNISVSDFGCYGGAYPIGAKSMKKSWAEPHGDSNSGSPKRPAMRPLHPAKGDPAVEKDLTDHSFKSSPGSTLVPSFLTASNSEVLSPSALIMVGAT
jgi:hypothetical protein